MRIGAIIICFLFFINSCVAQEISFQKDEYYTSETIIGTIEKVISDIKIDDLKIYEGTRMVFFEKGLIKVNTSYYFYIIPPKEGEFSLHIDNIMINNSGNIIGGQILEYFNVSSSNKSLDFKISPGVYEGYNPEIVVTNIKNETKNFTFGGSMFELKNLESVKININASDGFSMYSFHGYKIPINKFYKNSDNSSMDVNISVENKSINCVGTEMASVYSLVLNKSQNFSFYIRNLCTVDIQNITVMSNYNNTIFYDNNFKIDSNDKRAVNFELYKTTSGESEENFIISCNEGDIANVTIKILTFENETNLDVFNQMYDSREQAKCEDMGGEFCGNDRYCSSENYFYDTYKKEICCMTGCLNLDSRETNWLNVLMAILGFGLIGAILYFLWKRSKSFKSQKVEDKFKEAEKNYEKKFSDVKKVRN